MTECWENAIGELERLTDGLDPDAPDLAKRLAERAGVVERIRELAREPGLSHGVFERLRAAVSAGDRVCHAMRLERARLRSELETSAASGYLLRAIAVEPSQPRNRINCRG